MFDALLGITFGDNLKWKSQIYDKGGVIPSLNQRLFMIKRLKNSLNQEGLKKIEYIIFNSEREVMHYKSNSYI